MPTTTKKILVVEDDKAMNDMLQHKFQKYGCETEGCFDGEQALNLMNEKSYDAIVLDLMMPIKDGFAVLEERRTTKNSETPEYVLTTLGGEKSTRATELGARKVCSKADMSAAQFVDEVLKDLGA